MTGEEGDSDEGHLGLHKSLDSGQASDVAPVLARERELNDKYYCCCGGALVTNHKESYCKICGLVYDIIESGYSGEQRTRDMELMKRSGIPGSYIDGTKGTTPETLVGFKSQNSQIRGYRKYAGNTCGKQNF